MDNLTVKFVSTLPRSRLRPLGTYDEVSDEIPEIWIHRELEPTRSLSGCDEMFDSGLDVCD